MNPNIVRDSFERVDEVRVATWPDGVSMWVVRIGSTDPASDHLITFQMKRRVEDDDPVLSAALSSLGFPSATFSVERVDDGFVPIGVLNRDDADVFAPYLRWIFDRLGIVRHGSSPLLPGGTRGGTFNDPWVGRARATRLELLEQALAFDQQIESIRRVMVEQDKEWQKWVAGGASRPSGTGRFTEVATQMGIDGDELVASTLGFLDDLLDVGWVWSTQVPFRSTGVMKTKLLRPKNLLASRLRTSNVQTSTPNGWTRVMELEASDLQSVVEIVNSLFDDSRRQYEGFIILEPDEFEGWFVDDQKVGQLTIPDEEAEIYALMGEWLPYMKSAEELAVWAVQRWEM